ncbi:hypothetical protein ABEB36_002846 [Hypothenemus hampei]|uniref:Lipase n=1 Tax=Hypothenemus hampei TaxID=57062 RepID=A0ABD1F769_HYPHA
MKMSLYGSIFFLLLVNFHFFVEAINPEVYFNTEERIRKDGYPVELHPVSTEDGYILNLYRIPYGLKEDKKNRSVILFVHGQSASPYHFTVLGRKIAPAYWFADRGYDVWLFCARGVDCQNPRKHKTLDWDRDQIYWDFSFDEIGLYDLSASIDVVINKTGHNKIFSVCHSMGCSSVHALLAERPEYNKKLKININYAPMVVFKEFDYPLMIFFSYTSSLIKNISRILGHHLILPPSLIEMLTDTIRRLCGIQPWKNSCYTFLSVFGSRQSFLIQEDIAELAVNGFPRLSVRQMTHLLDHINKGEFRKYDYGIERNRVIYGRKFPPLYNLTLCSAPTAIFHGETDSLTDIQNLQEMEKTMPNVILRYKVAGEFVHLDFIFAKNATNMLYKPTEKLLKDFDSGRIKLRESVKSTI